MSKELDSVPKYHILEPPDRVAHLAEHWASIPKVVGSISTVARHIFQACPVWIHTQSYITNTIILINLLCTDVHVAAKLTQKSFLRQQSTCQVRLCQSEIIC